MRIRTLLALAAVATAFAVTPGSDARGAFGEFQLAAAPTVDTPSGGSQTLPDGVGTLVYTPAPAGATSDATIPGGTNVDLVSVGFNPGSGTTYTPYMTPFSVTFQLRDTTTNTTSPTFTATGSFSGYARGNTAGINSTPIIYAIAPTSWTIPSQGTYTVKDVSGGVIGAGNPSFVLKANVAAVAVPEPSSVALIGIGSASLVGLVLRRRLQVKA